LLPFVLVVANQFSLTLGESNLRNFSAFEEKIDAVLDCGSRVRITKCFDSGWFQSFAEKVRKIRDLDVVYIKASGLKLFVPELFRKDGKNLRVLDSN
jgi:hypothetical protein